MPPTKRVFLSDVHLGSGGAGEWYRRADHEQNLLALLNDVLARRNEIKDLVLLGDIFETWIYPVNATRHPEMSRILAHNQAVVDLLCQCVGALTNVFYLNGNHDMHVTADDLVGLAANGRKVKVVSRYLGGLLYAEHGHRFAMFNATDRMHDPADGFPLGFFVTRILSSTANPHDSPRALFSYLDDLLQAAFTTRTVAESLIEAVSELASLSPDSEITMPRARRPVKIAEVQRKYSALFDRWVEKFGHQYAVQAIRAELGTFGWFADRLAEKNGYRVVVLGHTHNAELDKDALLVRDERIYANAGYWCSPEPTFVEVDKQPGRFDVALRKVEGGQIADLDRAHVVL